ncbi:hypothetical protein GCM10027277_34550 [Pseudoduganella ginsengisoli]|uniref:Uncharacterized protein n=1 Tax=Pseudoduganella ginsengisoli TaxID=1462440 RepID=A0A6L6Q7V1_9BURK|nr:hypothetical protein [Pseudoduganella ginsengisoli]MTW05586.1 hypothetical protein [Pseudoduganella ginsengisoli]
MKWRDMLGEWGLSKLQLKLGFIEGEFLAQDNDRLAAWELYIELVTRVSLQRLPDEEGSEKQALQSIYMLFPTTREILKRHGPSAQRFARVAIATLNVILRPFLTRWHTEFDHCSHLEKNKSVQFRSELASLQDDLTEYGKLLARISDIEDLN